MIVRGKRRELCDYGREREEQLCNLGRGRWKGYEIRN